MWVWVDVYRDLGHHTGLEVFIGDDYVEIQIIESDSEDDPIYSQWSEFYGPIPEFSDMRGTTPAMFEMHHPSDQGSSKFSSESAAKSSYEFDAGIFLQELCYNNPFLRKSSF